MTADDFLCEGCDRTFLSSRARTQHRRFVHDGASLFGYRLTEDEESPKSAEDLGSFDSDIEGKEPEEESDGDSSDASSHNLELLCLVGAAFLGALILWGRPLRAPTTEGRSLPREGSTYGPSRWPSGGG